MAQLRYYWAVELIVDGVSDVVAGSLTTPQKVVEIDGRSVSKKLVPVPAGASNQVVWSWADSGGFELATFWVEGDGYLDLGLMVGTPTSESYQAPTGAARHWSHWDLSCVAPRTFDTDRGLNHTDAATIAGDTAGTPTLWADGARFTGVAEQFQVKNPGTEDVVLGVLVIQ